MIIAISGLMGSGKTTLGKLLAERLNLRFIAPTFKDLAKKQGISLEEFQKKAEKDEDIDKKFDEYILDEAKQGNCVVATWLAAWLLKDADLKVLVYAPLKVRAERVKSRDNLLEDSENYVKRIDENNRMRYLKIYGFDIYDISNFDIAFNSSKFLPEEMCEIIERILKR